MKAIIHVTLKNGVLDPQGDAILSSLQNKGYDKVDSVNQGKYFEVAINESDEKKAEEIANNICKDLLTNTVIENYNVKIVNS